MSREGRNRWGFGWRWNGNARTLFLGPGQRFLIGQDGNPMLERWRLISTPWFGLYVHFIYREDLDPVPHDHPWSFWSLILRGGYREMYRPDPRVSLATIDRAFGQGRLHHFPPSAAHRITEVRPGTTTLVLIGRKRRVWGFYDGFRWVDYRDALQLRPTEGVAWKRPLVSDHQERG